MIMLICPLCGLCGSAAPQKGAALSLLSDGKVETFAGFSELTLSAEGADEMKNDMFENLFDFIPYTRLRIACSETRENTVCMLK